MIKANTSDTIIEDQRTGDRHTDTSTLKSSITKANNCKKIKSKTKERKAPLRQSKANCCQTDVNENHKML